MKRIFTNLTFWVLLAITAGALVGNFAPATGVRMKVLADYFVFVVKLFIYPIIFLTISLGISGMGDLKKVGRVGAKAVIYFEVLTTLALLIGLLVTHVVKPGVGVDTSAIKGGDISEYVKRAKDFTWLQFFRENITIQVLIASILFGIFLTRYKHNKPIIYWLTFASTYVFKALKLFMYLAPLGAFGGMAVTIGKFGIHALLPLGKLMVCVYATCILFIAVVLGLLLSYYRVNIFRFLRYIRQELLIVFGTSSSESGLPTLMVKLERMGCSKPVTGLVVPAGYSFNLDGSTIYLSMAVIFLAQVYNVHFSTEQTFTIIAVLMIASKGAAGVTGSGFVVLASTLTAVKVVPVEGLAFLLGVDRFMSEARALTNIIGNGVATIWLSNNEKEFDRSKMLTAFAEKEPVIPLIPPANA